MRVAEWLPIGAVLVLDQPADVHKCIVNVEQMIVENGLPDDFRDHGPSGNTPTIPLF